MDEGGAVENIHNAAFKGPITSVSGMYCRLGSSTAEILVVLQPIGQSGETDVTQIDPQGCLSYARGLSRP